MKARMVVTGSALLLGAVGLYLNFAPQQGASVLGVAASPGSTVVMEVLAAALLGMAVLNWMSRANPVGGIYGRPLALGNFMLFGVSALALARGAFRFDDPKGIAAAAIVCGIFAAGFGWLIFYGDPVAEAKRAERATGTAGTTGPPLS